MEITTIHGDGHLIVNGEDIGLVRYRITVHAARPGPFAIRSADGVLTATHDILSPAVMVVGCQLQLENGKFAKIEWIAQRDTTASFKVVGALPL